MYTIGQLAKRAHLNADSVRFYERQGLLAPARKTSSGYRLYTDEALDRIDFIKQAQRCGFSLAETRELLGLKDGGDVTGPDVLRFLHEKQLEIAKSIAALQSMSTLLTELAAQAPPQEKRPLTVLPRDAHSGSALVHSDVSSNAA